MTKYVEVDKAFGYDLLCDWFISSVDDTEKPKWTPEHIEELLDGFYVIPKRKGITVTVFDAEPVRYCNNIGQYNKADEFVCSECGLHLEDWTRYVYDEDYNEEYVQEYVFKRCPECGAKVDAEDGDEQ